MGQRVPPIKPDPRLENWTNGYHEVPPPGKYDSASYTYLKVIVFVAVTLAGVILLGRM